jgi:hypothetical protein
MTRRIIAIFAVVVLVMFFGLAGLLATSEAHQMGSAAGIRYTFAHTGLQGYSFSPSPAGFHYEQKTWFGLGPTCLEVIVDKGRVLVNQVDRGPIQPGEQLTVTSDRRILINNRELGQ